MGDTKRLKSDEPDPEFREYPLVYLRDMDRQLQMNYATELDGGTQRPMAGNGNRRKGRVTMEKQEMSPVEHFDIGIIGITE